MLLPDRTQLRNEEAKPRYRCVRPPVALVGNYPGPSEEDNVLLVDY